jgi:hypothetical protein
VLGVCGDYGVLVFEGHRSYLVKCFTVNVKAMVANPRPSMFVSAKEIATHITANIKQEV